MPNTSLVQSPWSEKVSLTTGFQMGIKPKKTILGKFDMHNNDLQPLVDLFSVGADVYSLYQTSSGKIGVDKYNGTDFEFTQHSISDITWNVYQKTIYGNKVYLLLGDYPNVKLTTFDVVTKIWTTVDVDDSVCNFNSPAVSLCIRPIKVNNVVVKVDLYVIGIPKTVVGGVIPLPVFVKCDLDTNVWSSVDMSGWIAEGSGPGANCPEGSWAPALAFYNDGFYHHNCSQASSLWYYSFTTNTWVIKNNDITFASPTSDEYLLQFLCTDTKLIAVFEAGTFDYESNIYTIQFRSFKEYDLEKDLWFNLDDFPGMNDEETFFTLVGNSIYALHPIYGIMFPPSIVDIRHELESDKAFTADFTSNTCGMYFYQDHIYYFYGNSFTNNIIYNVGNGTTQVNPPINITYPVNVNKFYFEAACFYKDYLYVFGGCDINNVTNNNPSNKLFKIDLETGIATVEDETGIGTYGSSMIGNADKLYFVGGTTIRPGSAGLDSSTYVNLRYYDLITKTWTVLPNPISEMSLVHFPDLCVKDNVIYSVNGSSEGTGISSTDFRLYPRKWDTTTNTVTKLNLIPTQGTYGESIFFNYDTDLYITHLSPFYEGSSYKFYKYDTVADTYTLMKEYDASNYTHNHNNVVAVHEHNGYFNVFGELMTATPIWHENIDYTLISFSPTDMGWIGYGAGCQYVYRLIVELDKPFCTIPNEDVVELEYKLEASWFPTDTDFSIDLEYSLAELNALTLSDPETMRMVSRPDPFYWDGDAPNSDPLTVSVRVSGAHTKMSDWSQRSIVIVEPLPPAPLP